MAGGATRRKVAQGGGRTTSTGRPERRAGEDLRRTRTTILNQGDPEAKRAEIRRYFHDTYDIDEKLIETLKGEEAFYRRADPLRHPLIFYFGHTSVFYINKLVVAQLIERRVNPAYESMFAVGVDEMSWDDLDERHYDWPTPAEVKAYRDEARAVVDGVIQALPLTMPIDWDSPWWAILMGIEHARIHLETSSVLIRQLPLDLVVSDHPFWRECAAHGPAPDNALVQVPGGKVVLGKSRDHRLYGWDNEFGRHEAEVAPFKASRYLVSNGEFLAFIEDGGYRAERWWTDEGWRWRNYQQAEHPRFWRVDPDSYRLRTMLREIEMPWNWPVEVNYLEAKAFCNWKAAATGKPIRLPTEDEWYHLRDARLATDQPDWERAPGNINLEHHGSPCPVDTFAQGDLYDVVGNVWQWTETAITGFEGFEVHPYYDDFSTPTFDTQHNLIKGGSWISTGNEATRDSRYAFRRHFYQHAGLRYVESAAPVPIAENVYETDERVTQYCDFHYGPAHFGVGNFAVRLAEMALASIGRERAASGRALDVGCAVGRLVFELARVFPSVTGLDYSARFIRIGTQLAEQGRARYCLREEGELVSHHEVALEEFGLDAVRDRVAFYQADACNLIAKYRDYDLVAAGNLIDRLYDPRRFLETICERMRPGAVLLLASPYSWDEAYTERDKWLGGYRDAGEPVHTLATLREILAGRFEEVGAPQDVPFVIRETARKYQHSIAQVTRWRLSK